jgi:polar amino acid transport system permease protein
MLLSWLQWEFLLRGMSVTLGVALLAFPLALPVAFFAGLSLPSRLRVLRMIATTYIEIFRGTSALVQIFFVFFVLPLFDIELPPIIAGVLALGLNFGAYGAHIVRSAIQSVDRGQWEAAAALNMPRALAMRRIILPQAIIVMGRDCLAHRLTFPLLTFQLLMCDHLATPIEFEALNSAAIAA